MTDAEEHHDGTDDTAPTRGTVRSINAVYCRYAQRPGGDPTFRYPVAGTTVIEPRAAAERWEPEDEDRTFVGYLVDLETP